MANLTITVDDDVLRRARARALDQRTSVNAILSEHLARYARLREAQEAAVDQLLSLSERGTADDRRRAKRRGGRSWKRAELHER